MKNVCNDNHTTFADDFLTRLRRILNYLQQGAIKETERDGILYFELKFVRICMLNIYPGGIQLIFNPNLAEGLFPAAYDYSESLQPEWKLILDMLTDILYLADIAERPGKAVA